MAAEHDPPSAMRRKWADDGQKRLKVISRFRALDININEMSGDIKAIFWKHSINARQMMAEHVRARAGNAQLMTMKPSARRGSIRLSGIVMKPRHLSRPGVSAREIVASRTQMAAAASCSPRITIQSSIFRSSEICSENHPRNSAINGDFHVSGEEVAAILRYKSH